jgi:Carboxypeptidase regulatory-like domain/TonB dependent receptor-like, beta-barrel
MHARRAAVLAVILVLGIAVLASAQEASLAGTVTDGTGGVLPGVTVTAVHKASGNKFSTITDFKGDYLLAALRVGEYLITAELSGFSTVTQDGLQLLVGQRAVARLRMEVSTLQESVTVTGESPLVDTTQSKLGGNIDPRQMESLPVNGRNWLELVQLAPGARGNSVTEAPISRDNGAFQLNLDGQQVTSIISNSSFGNPRFSRDAIAEFQFVSNRFDATQGRSMGVQVNAVSKSGTNSLSGSFFGYFRDDKFNAADFIVNRVLDYSNQQVGGTFGGPIRKNKAHFFGYYEWEREPQAISVTTPYTAFNIGDFKGDRKEHKFGVRLDFQLTDQMRLTVRGNEWENHFPYDSRVMGGSTFHPSTASHTDRWSDQLFASLTQVVGKSAVNEIKGGYTSFVFLSDGYVPSPRITLRGFNIGKPSNYFQRFGQATTSIRDDLSFTFEKRGRHQVKTGLEYIDNLVYSFWPLNASGVIFADAAAIPSNIESLFPVWDDPRTWNIAALSPITSRYRQAIGDFLLYMPEDMWGLWFQDDWSINDRLTLNLGVRWDVSYGAFVEKIGILPWMPPNRPSDTDNISPRLGFAYSLPGGRTVIRGGAGSYYAAITNNQAHATVWAAQSAVVEIENDGRPDFASNPFNGPPPTLEEARRRYRQAPSVIDPAAETPYAYQTSIGLQRQIRETMAFEADYVYVGTRRDWMRYNMNLTRNPATGANYPFGDISRRVDPNWGAVGAYATWGYSNSHSMQAAFTKRFSHNWQASATYTLTHMKDTSTPYSQAPDNIFNFDADYSPSEADQRHRMVFNSIWQLPYDVQLSGMYFFGSGEHFNVTYGGDLRDTGGYSAGRLRPNGTVVPRNSFAGDPIHRLDMRVAKRIRIDRTTLEGFFEAFNVFNHENFGSYTTIETNANFGKPAQNVNLAFQPRMLQLGFRVSF